MTISYRLSGRIVTSGWRSLSFDYQGDIGLSGFQSANGLAPGPNHQLPSSQ